MPNACPERLEAGDRGNSDWREWRPEGYHLKVHVDGRQRCRLVGLRNGRGQHAVSTWSCQPRCSLSAVYLLDTTYSHHRPAWHGRDPDSHPELQSCTVRLLSQLGRPASDRHHVHRWNSGNYVLRLLSSRRMSRPWDHRAQ